MTIGQALFLGVIQGLTEFLPVSSSGHLVIFQKLLGLSKPPVLFDILVHIGTLTSVLIFFWQKIIKINKKQIEYIVIGSMPAVIVGLFLNKFTEEIFGSLFLVGTSLLVTSLLLFSTKLLQNKNTKKSLTIKKSFLIGLFQALAILPGISRSGSTIVAGLWFGLKRNTAFSFSFLLAIPAMMGALMLQIPDMGKNNFQLIPGIVGFIMAAIIGFYSLKLLNKFILKGKLYYFGFYCFVVGMLLIIGSFT